VLSCPGVYILGYYAETGGVRLHCKTGFCLTEKDMCMCASLREGGGGGRGEAAGRRRERG
jgi:hypothetical protein